MIEQLTEQEFNQYAEYHLCNTFFQSSYWGKLKQSTGWNYELLGYKEDGILKGATLLLSKKIPVINKKMYYAPRGFLLHYEDTELVQKFILAMKEYLKGEIFYKINPYVNYRLRNSNGEPSNNETNESIVLNLKKLGFKHNGYTITYGTDLEPRWLSVLNLKEKTEEQLLKEMQPNTRYSIRGSYKHGFKLTEIDDSRMSEFKELMLHTSERRGFIDRPLIYYQEMYRSFAKEDKIKVMLVELDTVSYLKELEEEITNLKEKIAKLADLTTSKATRMKKELEFELAHREKTIEEIKDLKEKNGETIVVAGGLFMTYGTQVLSLFGCSYREYMKWNPQYFLNFEMIKYALQNGYEKFNFYGITGEFSKDSPNYGLFDFKRGFNADVVELIGEFTYVLSPIANQCYQRLFWVYKKVKKMKNKTEKLFKK